MGTGDDLPPTQVLSSQYEEPPRRCPKCGSAVPRGAQHCPSCGHNLQPGSAGPLWAIGIVAFIVGLAIAFLVFDVAGVGQKTVSSTVPGANTQHISVTTPTVTATQTQTVTTTETHTVTTPPTTQTVTVNGSTTSSP